MVVYTPETLAEKWHITVKVVEEQLRTGTIQGFKVGRRWRITESAVEAHEQQATALTTLTRGGGGHQR